MRTRSRRRLGLAATAVALALVLSCTKRRPAEVMTLDGAPSSLDGAASSSPSSSSAPAPLASSAPAHAAVPPAGVATLVLQRVSSDCGAGEWGGPTERVHYLGTDVLVVLQGDDAKDKPRKEFAFCPSVLPDGGAQRPQLSLWQYCRAFPSCKVVSPDAGSERRVEVQCGKENLVLEADEKRTILRGSFGERELAPFPMTIGPVKKEERHAMVDC